MTTANDVLTIATNEIGVKENPPNSNLNKYGNWYGVNGVPWCAIFVSWCFDRAGLSLGDIPPTSVRKGFAYCPYGHQYFRDQGRSFPVSEAAIGDIVFFSWKGNGVANHVGIVESVGVNTLTTIEGNTGDRNWSNGGAVLRRTRSNRLVLSCGRPEYDGNSTVGDGVSPSWPGRFIVLTNPYVRGNDVLTWQRQMTNRGVSFGRAGADGIFGPITERFLRLFQEANKLEIDGIIGPKSWDAAFDENTTIPPFTASDDNENIILLSPDYLPKFPEVEF